MVQDESKTVRALVGQKGMMSLVQNDLPPIEFFTEGRTALPHATLLYYSCHLSFSTDRTTTAPHKPIHHGCPRAIRELQRVCTERGKRAS